MRSGWRSALVPFWMATTRIDDGDAWFARALASLADAAGAGALRPRLPRVLGRTLRARRGALHGGAAPRPRRSGDPDVQALALTGSARVALNDDPARAVDLLRRALVVTEGRDDLSGRSHALHVLGVALQMSGDLEGAREVMTERIRIARETDNEFVVWVESANLSMVERQLGNLDEAAIAVALVAVDRAPTG